MSEVYIAVRRTDDKNDELQHYGVIGMKWGVRRGNVSKTFAKASKKADSLQRKSNKFKQKSINKYFSSGKAYATDFGKERNAHDLQKSARYMKKSAKYEKKANKWVSQMTQEFATTKLSDISPRHLKKGKNYVDMLLIQ